VHYIPILYVLLFLPTHQLSVGWSWRCLRVQPQALCVMDEEREELLLQKDIAVESEREACAKVAEEMFEAIGATNGKPFSTYSGNVEKAIRERK